MLPNTLKKTIIVKGTSEIIKKSTIIMSFEGIKNPRTFEPTDSFTITSYDTDGVSVIDQGFNKNVIMTQPGKITEFSI